MDLPAISVSMALISEFLNQHLFGEAGTHTSSMGQGYDMRSGFQFKLVGFVGHLGPSHVENGLT